MGVTPSAATDTFTGWGEQMVDAPVPGIVKLDEYATSKLKLTFTAPVGVVFHIFTPLVTDL
jgi:hypothetical protein